MQRTNRLRRVLVALVLAAGFVGAGLPQTMATAAPPPIVKSKGVAVDCGPSVRHLPRTPAGFGHPAGDADAPRRCAVRVRARQFPRTPPHFQDRTRVKVAAAIDSGA